MSQERYVDESVQESLHETQIDATADTASFVGIVGDDAASPTDAPATVDVRLELPSGRVEDVPVSVPAASDWEGSLIARLLDHLGVSEPADLDAAVDDSVPIEMDGQQPRIDPTRLASEGKREIEGSFLSRLPALTEQQSDTLLLFAFGISWALISIAGHPVVGFGVALAVWFVGFLYVTPHAEGGHY